MDLIIKNGLLVTASESYHADISVKDGKIIAISNDLGTDATCVIDAKGKYVLPGAIDVHTHLAMPFGGTVSSDDYFAGTRAAACGGTTTVFDFALQNPNEPMLDVIKRRDQIAAPQAAVDYAFHIGVTDIAGELLDSMQAAVDFGVPSFKVFMVYDFGVSDGVFYELLKKSKEINAMISVHAENNDLVKYNIKKFLSEGKTSPWYHYLSRPEFVEGEADVRAIQWAKETGAKLYIVHLANKQGVEAVTQAKQEGYPIYAETCPQYLHFTRDVYKRDDARNFVCSPPMKGLESQDAIWAAVKRSDIDVVATDHCPFMQSEKDWGIDDFSKIPNGCAGIENMYPYMLDKANKGDITFNKAVQLCADNPAKIFGCSDKGSLTVGKDADIVIYDPNKDFTVTCEGMHSDYDHTIWEGTDFKGYPEMTFSRGRLVYKDGEFLGEAGYGKFIKRQLSY